MAFNGLAAPAFGIKFCDQIHEVLCGRIVTLPSDNVQQSVKHTLGGLLYSAVKPSPVQTLRRIN